mmetsp:Transcript_33947/g.66784  ORF Transcript_33947/g.66784 Transcript_33947/m.66784 type:complete len:461 (-) Transcript_33947:182-1564(-)
MGNSCITREDSPREAARQYEHCNELWREVVVTLGDDVGFSEECNRFYREECSKQGTRQLTKQQWRDMTEKFIRKITADDIDTIEHIYMAVDELYPGPDERPVPEGTFHEFTRLALTLAEQSLRSRLAKIQERHGGAMPVQGAMGGHHATSLGPPQTISSLPPGQMPPQPEPYQPRPVNTQQLQVPPSAQRLQEAQRQQAEQEARLQHLIMMQQQTQANQGPSQALTPQPPQTLASSWQQPSEQLPPYGAPIPLTQVRAPDGWHQNGPGQEEWVGGGPSIHERPVGTNQNAGYAGRATMDAMGGEGMDPHRSTSPTMPPDLMPPSTGQLGSYPFPQEEVESVIRLILAGQLKVFVFNEKQQMEPKRLAMNPHMGRISILSDAGLCEDSWDIDNLKCITEGIGSTILSDPPSPELCMAFRFKFKDDDSEDRFLCVVFDDADLTLLATEAFGQLCEVPVQRSG